LIIFKTFFFRSFVFNDFLGKIGIATCKCGRITHSEKVVWTNRAQLWIVEGMRKSIPISVEIAIDDSKEPIEAYAHIDGLAVQIAWNRGVRSTHLF
jgi:hypothetical protein